MLIASLPLIACASANAKDVRCPAMHALHALDKVSVFDGPPSELADLVPDDHGWTFDYAPAKGGFFLVCGYGDKHVSIPLPSGVNACRDDARGVNVTCR